MKIVIDVLRRMKELPPHIHGVHRRHRPAVGELVVVSQKVREIGSHIDPEEYVRQLSKETGQKLRLVPSKMETKNA